MKKIIWIFLLLFMPLSANAEMLYVVEFIVVDGVKKQNSSYTVESEDEIKGSNAYVLVTAEEYALLGDGSKWEKNTIEWLKKAENVAKVDLAITNKPKTDKEKLAELEAKITALEDKE